MTLNDIDLIRLEAACIEWNMLYRQCEGQDIEIVNACRKRMQELTSDITKLENKTGIPSRKFKTEDKISLLKTQIQKSIDRINEKGYDPHNSIQNNMIDGKFDAYKHVLTMIEYLG